MSDDLYGELIRKAFAPGKCGQFFKAGDGLTHTCSILGEHNRHVSSDNYWEEQDADDS